MKKRFILNKKAIASIMMLLLMPALPLWAQEMAHSRTSRPDKPTPHDYRGSVHDLAWLEGSTHPSPDGNTKTNLLPLSLSI